MVPTPADATLTRSRRLIERFFFDSNMQRSVCCDGEFPYGGFLFWRRFRQHVAVRFEAFPERRELAIGAVWSLVALSAGHPGLLSKLRRRSGGSRNKQRHRSCYQDCGRRTASENESIFYLNFHFYSPLPIVTSKRTGCHFPHIAAAAKMARRTSVSKIGSLYAFFVSGAAPVSAACAASRAVSDHGHEWR
jgi:hypothetical protein